MSLIPPSCENLPESVTTLLELWSKEPNLKAQNDSTTIETSLKTSIL